MYEDDYIPDVCLDTIYVSGVAHSVLADLR